jgi:hypothetical protein
MSTESKRTNRTCSLQQRGRKKARDKQRECFSLLAVFEFHDLDKSMNITNTCPFRSTLAILCTMPKLSRGTKCSIHLKIQMTLFKHLASLGQKLSARDNSNHFKGAHWENLINHFLTAKNGPLYLRLTNSVSQFSPRMVCLK